MSPIFNRGLLMNVGFQESSELYDRNCFIFHDLDFLTENIQNIYKCDHNPIHMSSAVDTSQYKISAKKGLTGVKAFSKDQFYRVNGFSNVHFGSGKEDTHLYYSLKLYQLRQQLHLSEGLSSLKCQRMIHEIRPLYTRILVGENNCTLTTTVGKEHVGRSEKDEQDSFYSFVSAKGVSIDRLNSDNKYRISYLKWSCIVDTNVAKSYSRKGISWNDMFETRIDVLKNKTFLPVGTLRKQLGVLPEDGTPITLVARQEDYSIPKENVIIRLNTHGPLDARTTMIMTWPSHVKTVSISARKQPNNELVEWIHYKPIGNGKHRGLWNVSQPLVVPEVAWNYEYLKHNRGPLFFMKGSYDFGNMSGCEPNDGIGLPALNRVAELKGDVSTLGFSLGLDSYNIANRNRFYLLVHKLVWSYFIVEEVTDTSLF